MKVSCIMPCNRPGDLEGAMTLFRNQDYPDKELLVLMDGQPSVTGADGEVYQYSMPELTIGAKRNALILNAAGEIILHMDSDDWYAPDWISRSVKALIESGAKMTGITQAYFYDRIQRKMYEYRYRGGQPYVIGASMCYYKSVYPAASFDEINEGEDCRFCFAFGSSIKAHSYNSGFIAMLHGANTASHKQLGGMRRVQDRAAEMMGADSIFFI